MPPISQLWGCIQYLQLTVEKPQRHCLHSIQQKPRPGSTIVWYKQDTASKNLVGREGGKGQPVLCTSCRVVLARECRCCSRYAPYWGRLMCDLNCLGYHGQQQDKQGQLSCSPAHVHPKLPRMQQAVLIKLILAQHGHTALFCWQPIPSFPCTWWDVKQAQHAACAGDEGERTPLANHSHRHCQDRSQVSCSLQFHSTGLNPPACC